MDELLIDEKKYISSKQAAKMTGYAKDYIGQLCREGRVPARLVGRSWYVLETAIQDHRFGITDIQPIETIKEPTPVLPPTWESPRYEASREELLPSVNRLREAKADKTIVAVESEELKASESLQDSWRAWFDHVNDDTETVSPVEVTPVIEEKIEIEEDTAPMSEIGAPTESVGDEEPVNIPIHTVYELPPENLLPRHLAVERLSKEQEMLVENKKIRQGGNRGLIRTLQTGGVLFAMVAMVLAALGSGYLDEYILSNSQVRIMAGVGLYNK